MRVSPVVVVVYIISNPSTFRCSATHGHMHLSIYSCSVSPRKKKEEDNRLDELEASGPKSGGMGTLGQKAFHDMFKEAMEGGCVEVGCVGFCVVACCGRQTDNMCVMESRRNPVAVQSRCSLSCLACLPFCCVRVHVFSVC